LTTQKGQPTAINVVVAPRRGRSKVAKTGKTDTSSCCGSGCLIDVHHHIVPPFYLAENSARIADSRGGQISRAWLEWTPQKALDAMDDHGVETAILSLSTPGVWFGDAQSARDTARRSNEYAAELVQKHPGRFGLFAAIPLPDISGSLAEIHYALDVLKADGIGLLTSYADRWLGDAAFAPVMDELDRRHAVVFVHPTVPSCCQNLIPAVMPLISEVTQDTTRAITNMLFTGTLSRLSHVRFIFTHAGGHVPMVAGRMHQYGPADLAPRVPRGIDYELRRLFYDIAGTTSLPAIAALTSLVPITQILFGSDNPYIPVGETVRGLASLDLSESDLKAIRRGNALSLFPRLGRDAPLS